MKDLVEKIESQITQIKQENVTLKNELEESALNTERQIDALVLDIIQVIDAYEKAESVVKEKGYSENETAGKAIKRMMQPKKIAQSILIKFNVQCIDIENKVINENLCTVIDTEPDPSKEDGLVISVEKNGYLRGDRLIRRAEVIIVRN